MLGNILKEIYGRNRAEDLRRYYQSPVVCGCLFQSFDDFSKNIILRFITNECRLSDKQITKQLDPNDPNVQNELKETFMRLEELSIIQFSKQELCYKMLRAFSANLQRYILNPVRITGAELPVNYKSEIEEFDLLGLLNENNEILKECDLSSNIQGNLTKQNFDYIRAPVYEKIAILIKGYLKYNRNNAKLQDILTLSLLNPKRAYRITKENSIVVRELESLKLLKRINENQFVINQYLHEFGFYSKRSGIQKKGSLNCKIVIETNFKVYAEVESRNPNNYRMMKSILKSLISFEYEQYELQQLIVGQIKNEKMMELFKKGITSAQYFDFFQQYMEKSQKIEEKDLGKWNKIKFLGLEGIDSGSTIPNNVRQEIKLWENMHKYNKSNLIDDLEIDSDSEEVQ